MTKQERVDLCNQVIRIIASHGRRFFSMDAERKEATGDPRISRFELDQRGRIWFVDKYTEKRIYVAYEYRWRGFSDGGTLRSLVCSMRDWIGGKKADFPMGHFGPFPLWVCGDGDLWGYGLDAMATMRTEIEALIVGSGVTAKGRVCTIQSAPNLPTIAKVAPSDLPASPEGEKP